MPSPAAAASQRSTCSSVMPQSMIVIGSTIAPGAGPSAGGAAQVLQQRRWISRRSATIGGQYSGPSGLATRAPGELQVGDGVGDLGAAQEEQVVDRGDEPEALTKSSPNSRILRQNSVMYQCSM